MHRLASVIAAGLAVASMAGAVTAHPADPPAVTPASVAVDPTIAERLAQWRLDARAAERAGDSGEALRLWARVARVDADPPDARAALEALAAHPPPVPSRPLTAARRALPRGFAETRTRSFVVLSNADAARTQLIARRLEHVRSRFEAFARRLDLPMSPIRHRLVCIVFDRRRDFLAFAREHDGIAAGWCHGYYAPRHDRVVVYDAASEPGADAFAEARGTAALVHETVHQLSLHRLVQDATVQYPLWLAEGLATSFETSDTHSDFGPSAPFDARERRLARLVAEDRLLPLEAFVVRTQVLDDDADTIEAVYGQCYGFFSWLVTSHPDAVRRFLAAMHQEPPGRVSPDRLRELFDACVGPVATIERRWRLHVTDRTAHLATQFAPADGVRLPLPALARPEPSGTPQPVPPPPPPAGSSPPPASESEPPR